MSWDDQPVLAVVPARGGSKGIPGKNLRRLGSLSLVARAVLFARRLPWVDRVMLSTEDEEIAAEGRRHGAEVPVLRPPELAGDLARSVDAWRHAWLIAEEEWGTFPISLLLEPTSPLRVPEDAERTLHALVEGGHAAAATVSPTPGHFTPEKMLRVDPSGVLQTYLPRDRSQTLRQLIPPYVHRNGLCYAARRRTVVEARTITEEACAAVQVARPVVNIDEPFDLELAEWLLERQERRRGRHGDDAGV